MTSYFIEMIIEIKELSCKYNSHAMSYLALVYELKINDFMDFSPDSEKASVISQNDDRKANPAKPS